MNDKFKGSAKNELRCRGCKQRPGPRRSRLKKRARSKQRRREGWDLLAGLIVSAAAAHPELVKRGVKIQ